MFASLSLSLLIFIFVLAAAVIWYAGIQLSNTTEVIDRRFGLGDAMGGMIFLAIATNLPEIAIVISAALSHNLGIAIGNLLGGIAIQTVVLVFLDSIGLRQTAALSYKGATLQLILESILAITILLIAIMGTQLPQSLLFARFAPGDLFIVAIWLVGLWLIKKARSGLPWRKKDYIPPNTTAKENSHQKKVRSWSILRVISTFILAALATLAAGVVLEESSSAIAKQIGWSGVLFGSTILAAATALPEISTGFTAIKNKDYTLAISDIMGGNAFLPVLFILATFFSGQSVLPQAKNSDIYLASLGALLMAVYCFGLIFRSKRQILYMGIDSFVVLILYIAGILGLFIMTGT